MIDSGFSLLFSWRIMSMVLDKSVAYAFRVHDGVGDDSGRKTKRCKSEYANVSATSCNMGNLPSFGVSYYF